MRILKSRAEKFVDNPWVMLACGAVGGLLGTYAMEPVANYLYEHEDEAKRKREEELRKEVPTEVLAARLIELVGGKATPARKQKLGMIVHLGYGIGWGILYAFLRRRAPFFRKPLGLPFGILFALVGDEIMNQVMGLTAPPKAWQVDAHLRGLAGHIVYAAAAEGACRAMDAVASRA